MLAKFIILISLSMLLSCDGLIKKLKSNQDDARIRSQEALDKANATIAMADKELKEHDELMAFLECKPTTPEEAKKCDEMRAKLSPENQKRLEQ